jgi:hypothetical protein
MARSQGFPEMKRARQQTQQTQETAMAGTKPLSKAQASALSLFAAEMPAIEVRAATISNLLRRGYLELVPVPANNGLHLATITQEGRDAAFSALLSD